MESFDQWSFVWDVAQHGYTWQTEGSRDEAVLCPQGERVRRFRHEENPWTGVISQQSWGDVPMIRSEELMRTKTGLFLTFADIPPTPEGLRAFANTFGLLWEEGSPATMLHPHPTQPRYKDWILHLLLLRCAVGFLELWRTGATTRLAASLEWRETSHIWVDTHPACKHDHLTPSLFTDYPMSSHAPLLDAIGMASHLHPGTSGEHPALHIRAKIEREQPGTMDMSPQAPHHPAIMYLRRLMETALQTSIAPAFIGSPMQGKLRLGFRPVALLDALWCQCAMALDGRDYRQCQECQQWFELTPTVNRVDRRYCSDPCRARGYRQRIRAAKHRAKAGEPVDAIAQALGTTVETVQGWVTQRRRTRAPQQR